MKSKIVEDTKGVCKECEKRRGSVLYHSDILNKNFTDYDELVKAEEEFERENAEKLQLAEVKKTRAKEVEDAYLELQKTKKECYDKIQEAEKKWIELRDKFSEDYHGYHMTYSNVNGKESITFSDLIDNFFGRF